MIPQLRRGNPFVAKLTVPSSIQDGNFSDTFLTAKIRKQGNNLPSGYVDDLGVVWKDSEEDEGKYRTVEVFFKDTSHWPLGVLEYDACVEKADGETYYLPIAHIEIIDTVTG